MVGIGRKEVKTNSFPLSIQMRAVSRNRRREHHFRSKGSLGLWKSWRRGKIWEIIEPVRENPIECIGVNKMNLTELNGLFFSE